MPAAKIHPFSRLIALSRSLMPDVGYCSRHYDYAEKRGRFGRRFQ
jgi:hypothetical protein